MESLRIAHFSNLYLYYNFENLNIPPEVGEEVKQSVKSRFFEVMDNLSNKKIDAVIFSGNTLYFEDILPKDLQEFNSVLEKFGQKVFIVPGDIDPYSLYSKFNFSDNVHIFHNNKIDKFELDDGVYFYGIGEKLQSLDLITSIPTLQSAINVFCAFDPDLSNLNDMNFKNFNYIAFGGSETYEVDSKKYYLSSSFSSYNWNVTNNFYLLAYISKDSNSVSKVLSNSPKFYSVTINFSKKLDIKEYLRSLLLTDEYKGNVLRVYLKGRNFEFVNFENIKSDFENNFIYFDIINNLVPDKRSLKNIEYSFANFVEDKELLYKGVEFLRGKGDY